MGFTTTTETQNTAGPQSAQGAAALQLLGDVGQTGADQLGDLSQIAGGNFQLSPAMMQYIAEAQRVSGDMGRAEMERNLQSTTRQIEDTAIGRQNTGGSFEAVSQALMGQEALHGLNMQGLQQEGQSYETMVNAPLQYGQMAIEGNRALLDRLVGGTGAVAQYDANMRGLNSSQYGEQTVPFGQQMMQLGGQIGAARVGRPA